MWKPALIAAALAFLYASVLAKLGQDWLTDDNYSHGLLIPFVIGYIVWLGYDDISSVERRPNSGLGIGAVSAALLMLLFGSLASELYMQRLSLVVMLGGVVAYFFGTRVVRKLTVPFLLILLAIPIPQIIFNKIALPLQLLASRLAAWSVTALGIPSVRQGNVLEIVPAAGGKPVLLEVVEACSGIRSLMTLVTLALILGYLTADRRRLIGEKFIHLAGDPDAQRTAVLLFAALPIAVLTNGVRVAGTAVMTYYYGTAAAEGWIHESAGAFVFVAALVMLLTLNAVLKRFLGAGTVSEAELDRSGRPVHIPATAARTAALFIAILAGGVLVNWLDHRGEAAVSRLPLSAMPSDIGEWKHRGTDLRFDEATEKVLKADDYVMRYYFSPRVWVNFYTGYYASQSTGATYHSPLNCLPGSGWEMTDRRNVEIHTPSGKNFTANRYDVRRGGSRQIMVYWYQGRGRSTASEYSDKLYTSADSLFRRRSDGALVRIMAPVTDDEEKTLAALLDFAARAADELSPFVPE